MTFRGMETALFIAGTTSLPLSPALKLEIVWSYPLMALLFGLLFSEFINRAEKDSLYAILAAASAATLTFAAVVLALHVGVLINTVTLTAVIPLSLAGIGWLLMGGRLMGASFHRE
ncbi:MAG: hypothetical protein SVU88_04490 [Candidatus Nanohaloarchaea archaeon]|nr:hypothetical protein [Candidatus Nanohaloarchaea archaeon]